MKKLLFLITTMIILVCVITSCGNNENVSDPNEHPQNGSCAHMYGEWITILEATCKNDGKATRKCSFCNAEDIKTIPQTNTHTVVIDSAVEATCTTTGLTEGKHCSVCNEVLVAQNVVETKTHTEVIDSAVEATCTTTGLTEGKHCSVCNETLVAQTTINAYGHTEVIDNAVDPTCTKTGLTEGKHCSVCNDVLIAQTNVAAAGHTYELTASTKSTCTNAGSETYTCIECGDSYLNELTKLPHTYQAVVGTTPAACEDCGYLKPSEWLKFSSVSGGYSVAGIGSCTDSVVVIPETYNGKPVVQISANAFKYCNNLTAIAIPSSVTYISSAAFGSCYSLTAVYITDIAAWCNIDFSGFEANPLYYAENLYLNNELVADLVIPEGVESIRKYAFYNYSSLTSATIGNSVTSIGAQAFVCCSSLVNVTIENSVTSIGGSAFYGCSSLDSIIIPDSVTSIDVYAFSRCSSLTSVTIGNKVSSIGEQAFSECSNLTDVTIGNNVTSIGDKAFYSCSGLTSIYIPNSVITMGSKVFSGCSNLKDIYIGYATIPSTWQFDWGGWISATVHYAPQCVQHTWQKATCTTPKTCTVCMLTQGDPAEHTWQKATCTTPKTCSFCGVTNGNPLGHSYSEPWSCTEPNICSVCQETTTGHNWQAATCSKPKTCSKCNTTTGSPLTHILDQSGVCYFCYEKIKHTVSLDNNFGKTISVKEGLFNFTIDGDLVGVANSVTIYGPVSNLVGTLTFYWDGASVYTGDFVSGYTSSPLISGTYTVKFSYYSSYDLVVRGGKYVRVGKGAITTTTLYLKVE